MISAPAQRRQPGRFGIPLVPADADADAAELGAKALKAEIAGREIELFVVQRVVGNVHLAIEADLRAVGVEDDSRVVIDAGGASLEQRADDDDAMLLRGGGKGFARRAGNRLGLGEPAVVLGLAEVRPVNSSCRQTMFAPALPPRRFWRVLFRRSCCFDSVQVICTRATETGRLWTWA